MYNVLTLYTCNKMNKMLHDVIQLQLQLQLQLQYNSRTQFKTIYKRHRPLVSIQF